MPSERLSIIEKSNQTPIRIQVRPQKIAGAFFDPTVRIDTLLNHSPQKISLDLSDIRRAMQKFIAISTITIQNQACQTAKCDLCHQRNDGELRCIGAGHLNSDFTRTRGAEYCRRSLVSILSECHICSKNENK